ncbi:chromo domain-containing protein [Colletotrichum truncatum]|uniref:Chromo domain-containing protein n=2 Tax=Colletotrichum truncatum TaxID=5467 RepID=A0ACC3YCH0_COLTU
MHIAPTAPMDCSEELSSPVAKSEDATVFWNDVLVAIEKVLVAADRQIQRFDAEELVAHRLDEACDTQFETQVRWKGKDETWEPEENIAIKKATVATDSMCGRVHGTAAQDVAADTQIHRFVFEELLAHRRDPTCDTHFEIRVRWKGNDETWEPEINIQKDAPLALFAYWKRLKGGREGAMVDNGLWHPFKVESHKIKPAGSVYLEVAWVGSPETSWEPEKEIQEADEKLVKRYWASVGGRAAAMKRPTEVKSSVRMNKSCKVTHPSRSTVRATETCVGSLRIVACLWREKVAT